MFEHLGCDASYFIVVETELMRRYMMVASVRTVSTQTHCIRSDRGIYPERCISYYPDLSCDRQRRT